MPRPRPPTTWHIAPIRTTARPRGTSDSPTSRTDVTWLSAILSPKTASGAILVEGSHSAENPPCDRTSVERCRHHEAAVHRLERTDLSRLNSQVSRAYAFLSATSH